MAKKNEADAAKSGTPTLQTVERALTFMEYVAGCATPPSIQDVSADLDLNITTCYHLMRTLVARGYILRLADGKLAIGNAIGGLFRAYRMRLSVDMEISGIIRQLADATSETAFFSAPEGNSVILKVLVEGSRQLRVGGLFVGMTGNEHLRASGRAILSYLPSDQRLQIIKACFSGLDEPSAAQAISRLVADLKITAERGWAYDAGETEQGVSAIGFPVFDGHGKIYGALGVIGPALRMKRSHDSLLGHIKQMAEQTEGLLKNAMTT
ncbi:IclR family transcriptional regulator [Celeribacter baekdonensis]|uniref:IclR family transcriptional regulator n=1 Tax=Celeribacter baekdonensis TaxID=875171 RepID=UPI003A951DF8